MIDPKFGWNDLAALVRRLTARRWIRFGLTGGAATLAYVLLGLLFVKGWNMPVLLGNALAYLLSFIVSYLGQSRWTFASPGTRDKGCAGAAPGAGVRCGTRLPRFASVQALGLVLNSVLVGLCVLCGLSYELSMLAATAAVPVVVYFLCKYWVFRSNSAAPAGNTPARTKAGNTRFVRKDQP